MDEGNLFEALEQINERPGPFEYYTAQDLWTDDYTSQQMLSYHLNGDIDVSSRNTAFINRSVEWIVSHFKVGAGTKIADFGCGPGLYATRLAKTGAEITGIDFSKRSIQYAQEIAIKDGVNINFVNRNYLEFDTDDRFDLILMIMCDFCALSPAQRNEMLAKFFTLLKPRGAVLLDVYSLKAFADRQEQASYEANLLSGFWSPHQYYGFLNTFKYEDEKVVLDKYTIIDAHRTRTVYNWLQYFGLDTLAKEFTEKGFVIEDTFSDVAGNPFDPGGSEFAVVAGKG
jgi:SAM-dependent methyltransferase